MHNDPQEARIKALKAKIAELKVRRPVQRVKHATTLSEASRNELAEVDPKTGKTHAELMLERVEKEKGTKKGSLLFKALSSMVDGALRR